jgi:GAF domain-containing protein
LLIGEGVLCALDVQSTEEAAFDDNDIEILQNMANQVAVAIANANLFEQTQRGVQAQFLINEISNQMQSSLDVEGIMTTTVTELGKALGAKSVSFHLEPKNKENGNQ